MTKLRLLEDKERGVHVDPPEAYSDIIFNSDGRCLYCGHPGSEDCICATVAGCVCCALEVTK